MTKFEEFLKDVKSKNGVDVDGALGKQCLDLSNYFLSFMVGAHNVGARCAKEVIFNDNIYNYCDRIDNYPEFVPQKGDIAVWTGGDFGHIAICLGEGDVNGFKTLDQNWKEQQLTEEWHDYIYLAPLVFFRLKDQSGFVEPQPVQPEPIPTPAPTKSIDEIAREVLNGDWEDEPIRSQKLIEAGYDPKVIQDRVNEIYYGTTQPVSDNINVGDKVKVLNAIQYNGETFATYYDIYDVIEIVGDRVVIGIGNEVTCAININNIQKV